MADDLFDDDYDPLARPESATSAEDAADPAVDGELGDADVDFGSVSGGDGIVRIWFDDDRRLSKVRVSPVWFERLQGSQTLESAFAEAFRLAHLDVGKPRSFPAPEQEDETDDVVPEFSLENLRAMTAELSSLMDEWDAAVERRLAADPAPEPRRVVGRSEGVTVTLNTAGYPWSVAFDQRWLDDAQVGAICTHVLAAAQRAQSAFVPAVDEAVAELAHFKGRHDRLMTRALRMMDPEGKR